MSLFGGEKIIYITGTGYQYGSMYAITETGKLWGWGRNADGQLGLGNTTQQTTPQHITGVSGSQLENKKVVHLFSSQDGDDVTRTWVLTDEGIVYFMGQRESHGIYCGSYDTSSTSYATSPVPLTNSATLWNSNNQKVIYMAIGGGRYPTIFLITDGGSTGHAQKIYATGSNNYGHKVLVSQQHLDKVLLLKATGLVQKLSLETLEITEVMLITADLTKLQI